MVRQLQEDEPMQTVTVRMPVWLVADIDAYRAMLKAQNRAFRIERGEAVRDLLLKALALVQTSGTAQDHSPDQAVPVEAPVPLEADQTADHADHPDRKAAHSQDHKRTTGRKRTTAAKG